MVGDELQELTDLIEFRPSILAEALAQLNNIPGYFYGMLAFSKASHPSTYALVQGALRVAQFQVVFYKNKFQRPRPSQLSPNLMPPVDVPGHASFPSGHSTEAYTLAYCLSEVFNQATGTTGATIIPSQPDPLMRLADRIARNREILGLHYRSDSKAGKELAEQTVAIFKNCPTVSRLIPLAAAEWLEYAT